MNSGSKSKGHCDDNSKGSKSKPKVKDEHASTKKGKKSVKAPKKGTSKRGR